MSVADAFAFLEVEAFGTGQSLWNLADYQNELNTASSKCFKIKAADGSLSAFVFYRLTLDECHITHLAVRDKGGGEGFHLLTAFIAELRRLGLHKVFLEVSALNEAAVRLYLKTGFHQIGLRKSYYKDGSDALVMTRTLKGSKSP